MRRQLEHRVSLCSDLRVTLNSQQAAMRMEAAGQGHGMEKCEPYWRARQWLSYIDLHGLDLPHAMKALRQRLCLLQSGCAAPGTPLPPEVTNSLDPLNESIRLPNHWLPKRLKVITGWGSGSPRLNDRKPTSILRVNVINFLRTGGYDFDETPHSGCGCFEVRLGDNRRTQS